MTNKNRKLIVRPGKEELTKAFRIKAIEQMIAELPDDAWRSCANESTDIARALRWSSTPEGDGFWYAIHGIFTLAPLKESHEAELEALRAQKAEIEARIAEIEGI